MSEYSFTQQSSTNGVTQTTPIIRADLTFPSKGRWVIEARVQSDTPLSGTITFSGDEISLTGVVLPDRSGFYNQTNTVYVVGGSGGIINTIPAKNYDNNPTVQSIVSDIMSECAETLDPANSNSGILTTTVPKFVRTLGKGQDLLSGLLQSLSQNTPTTNYVWKTLDSGNIVIVQNDYSTTITDLLDSNGNSLMPQFDLLEQDYSDIQRTFYVDSIPTNLRPGVTWTLTQDGVDPSDNTSNPGTTTKKVSVVKVRIDQERTRIETLFEPNDINLTNSAGRVGSGIVNIINSATNRTKYNVFYTGTIASTHSDGTVDFQPDPSPTQVITAVTNIPIRTPSPGFSTTPSVGAKCVLTFENGNQQKPVVILFDMDASMYSQIVLGDPSSAQFMPLGQDLKTALENTLKTVIEGLQITAPSMGGLCTIAPPTSWITVNLSSKNKSS